jgi:hypothetical protein
LNFQLDLGQNGVNFQNAQKHVAQASFQELACVMVELALVMEDNHWSVTLENALQVTLI